MDLQLTKMGQMIGTMRNMLLYPKKYGKQEALLWVSSYNLDLNVVTCILHCGVCSYIFHIQKALLAKRRRETLGFNEEDEQGDIKFEEEFCSSDYDSDDLHEAAFGDNTTDGVTTDDEGNF